MITERARLAPLGVRGAIGICQANQFAPLRTERGSTIFTHATIDLGVRSYLG